MHGKNSGYGRRPVDSGAAVQQGGFRERVKGFEN
jgi:hypothetical protein